MFLQNQEFYRYIWGKLFLFFFVGARFFLYFEIKSEWERYFQAYQKHANNFANQITRSLCEQLTEYTESDGITHSFLNQRIRRTACVDLFIVSSHGYEL